MAPPPAFRVIRRELRMYQILKLWIELKTHVILKAANQLFWAADGYWDDRRMSWCYGTPKIILGHHGISQTQHGSLGFVIRMGYVEWWSSDYNSRPDLVAVVTNCHNVTTNCPNLQTNLAVHDSVRRVNVAPGLENVKAFYFVSSTRNFILICVGL